MKIVKYGILGIIIGEIIYLFTKDKKLAAAIKKEKGYRKLNSLTKEIITLNKHIIKKAKQVDYKNATKEAQQFIKKKEKNLRQKTKEVRAYIENIGDKKLSEVIDDMEDNLKGAVGYVKKAIAEEQKINTKPSTTKTTAGSNKATTKKATTKKPTAKKTATKTSKKKTTTKKK